MQYNTIGFEIAFTTHSVKNPTRQYSGVWFTPNSEVLNLKNSSLRLGEVKLG